MRSHPGAAGALLVVLAAGWNFANIGPAADTLRITYGTSLATVGLLVSALALTHTAANVPAGRLADRVGPRRVVLAGVAIVVGTNVLAAAAPSLGLAFPMRLAGGLGTATSFVAAADYVRLVTRSPFAQGLVGGGSLAGAGLALAIVPQLDALGWRAPYLSAAAVAVIAAVVFGAGSIETSSPLHGRTGVAPIRSLLRDLRLYRVGTIHVCSMGTSVVVATWVVTLLTRDGGYGGKEAGLVGSLMLLVGVVTRPAGGWLRHRRPAALRRVLQASLLVAGVATVVVAAAPPLPVAAVACAVVGLAAGVPFAPAFDAAASLRPDAPAAAVGVVNTLANVFVLVGTPIVGALFAVPSGGRTAIAAIGVLTALAALAVPAPHVLGIRRGHREAAVERAPRAL